MASSDDDAADALWQEQLQLQQNAKDLVKQLSGAQQPLQRGDVHYRQLVGVSTTTQEHYVPIGQGTAAETEAPLKLTPALSLVEREALFSTSQPDSVNRPSPVREVPFPIQARGSPSPLLEASNVPVTKAAPVAAITIKTNPSPSPAEKEQTKVSPIKLDTKDHLARLGEWAEEGVSIRPPTDPTSPEGSARQNGGLMKKQSFRFDVEGDDEGEGAAGGVGGGSLNGASVGTGNVYLGKDGLFPKSILMKKVPSFKFPSPEKGAGQVVNAPGAEVKTGPSPPKGLPPKKREPVTVDVPPPATSIAPKMSGLSAISPHGGGGSGSGSGEEKSPMAGSLRPISREEVNRMVIPTFGQIHSPHLHPASHRGSNSNAENTGLLRAVPPDSSNRGSSRGGSLSRGGAFPVLLEKDDDAEDMGKYTATLTGSDTGEVEEAALLGDLSQHNFISNINPVTGSAEKSDMAKLESNDNMFADRPGTHERPSTTQLRYMDLYAEGLLRLQTPKAAAMNLENLFDQDLEVSHRSVQSDITTDDYSINTKANKSVLWKNKATQKLKPLKKSAEPSQGALPFHFPVSKPTMPHVDAGISNPQMHFDKIKAKFLSPAEIFQLEKKMKYLKKAKAKKLASKRDLMGRMRKKDLEDSLMAEFSHAQIDSAMEYFRVMCSGLSSPTINKTGDLYSGSELAAVEDEIKLNELEAVIRKYRRAQCTNEEESNGRGLLVSLDWLLKQLDMSPMHWFELTDTTRANNPKLAGEVAASHTSNHMTNILGIGVSAEAGTHKTKGNGKLTYIELVFGIDMLCDKLSEKLTSLAIHEAQQAADASQKLLASRLRAENFKEDTDDDDSKGSKSPSGKIVSPTGSTLGSHRSSPLIMDSPKVNLKKKAKKEPVVSITKVVVPHWKRADMYTLLKYLDPNGDGDVSAEEMQLAFRNLHGGLQSEKLMQEAGPIVSRLVDYLQSSRLKVKDLFRLIDTDRSGTISSKELFDAMKSMPPLNKTDTDDQSVGSIGSMSLGSMSIDSNSVTGSSVTSSNWAGMSLSDKSHSTTDFKSPFKYVQGSRALMGARAFGKLNQNVMTTKMYDIEKLNARLNGQTVQSHSRSRSPSRTGERGFSRSPSPEPSEAGNLHVQHPGSVSMPSMLSMQTGPMVVNPLTSKVTFMLPVRENPIAANNTNSRRNSMAAQQQDLSKLTRLEKVPKQHLARALDPKHKKRIDHYSGVWEKQIKKLEMPQQHNVAKKEI